MSVARDSVRWQARITHALVLRARTHTYALHTYTHAHTHKHAHTHTHTHTHTFRTQPVAKAPEKEQRELALLRRPFRVFTSSSSVADYSAHVKQMRRRRRKRKRRRKSRNVYSKLTQ